MNIGLECTSNMGRVVHAWDRGVASHHSETFDTVPHNLLRDRNSIDGEQFSIRIKSLSTEERYVLASDSLGNRRMWSGLLATTLRLNTSRALESCNRSEQALFTAASSFLFQLLSRGANTSQVSRTIAEQ